MIKLVQASIVLALISLSIFLWVATYQTEVIGKKVSELTSTLDDTAKDIKEDIKPIGEYAKFQTIEFQSDRSQKLLEHNLSIGKNAIRLIQKIDRTTVPRLNSNLDESQALIVALRVMTQGVDKNINVDILPEVGRLVKEITTLSTKLGITVEDLNKTITIGLSSGTLALDNLNKVLTDPNIQNILANLAQTSGNVQQITDEVAQGFEKFPTLMSLWEEYSRTANKYHKWVLLAQIINLLGGIPRP